MAGSFAEYNVAVQWTARGQRGDIQQAPGREGFARCPPYAGAGPGHARVHNKKGKAPAGAGKRKLKAGAARRRREKQKEREQMANAVPM